MRSCGHEAINLMLSSSLLRKAIKSLIHISLKLGDNASTNVLFRGMRFDIAYSKEPHGFAFDSTADALPKVLVIKAIRIREFAWHHTDDAFGDLHRAGV